MSMEGVGGITAGEGEARTWMEEKDFFPSSFQDPTLPFFMEAKKKKKDKDKDKKDKKDKEEEKEEKEKQKEIDKKNKAKLKEVQKLKGTHTFKRPTPLEREKKDDGGSGGWMFLGGSLGLIALAVGCCICCCLCCFLCCGSAVF